MHLILLNLASADPFDLRTLPSESVRDFDEELADGAPGRDVDLRLRDPLCSKRVFFVNGELDISAGRRYFRRAQTLR
jgi:hypothetical protein